LRVSGNEELGINFGLKRDEETKYRKLYNEELHKLYTSHTVLG